MAPVDPIKIKGLVELQAALKAVEDGAQKKLRVVFNSVAETVAQGAARRVKRGKTGHAAGSIRAQSGQREAKVIAGGRKAPYFPWLDFGGRVGRNRSVSRPFIADGRYLYPTYRAQKDSLAPALDKALHDLVVEAGLKEG